MSRFVIIILSFTFVMELFHGYGLVENRDSYRQREIVRLKASNAMELKAVADDYEVKIYQKSGDTVFDRAFNRPNQTIEAMIKNLAAEAVPDEWDIDVRVEEFSQFILLLYLPQQAKVANVDEIVKYIEPAVKYAEPYLKNIAVFNYKRQAYLFFDELILQKIRAEKSLSPSDVQRIWQQGQSFQSFNAVPIKFETYNGHMVIPVRIVGDKGLIYEKMLFDTGASMTVISLESAQRTQDEDLNKAEWKEFETASGVMRSPITKRKIIVGSIEKEMTIAVFPSEEQKTGLLGVDFLREMRYVVDSSANTIYVWEKKNQ